MKFKVIDKRTNKEANLEYLDIILNTKENIYKAEFVISQDGALGLYYQTAYTHKLSWIMSQDDYYKIEFIKE